MSTQLVFVSLLLVIKSWMVLFAWVVNRDGSAKFKGRVVSKLTWAQSMTSIDILKVLFLLLHAIGG